MISDRLLMNSVNQLLTKVCNLNTNTNYSFYVSTLRIQSIIFLFRNTRLVLFSQHIYQNIYYVFLTYLISITTDVSLEGPDINFKMYVVI